MRNGLLGFFLLLNLFAFGQNLQVQQEGSKLYLNHTVAAKENWYSIGRMYNISPRDIAPFNSTTIEKGLSIGQKIRVPLTDVNLAQAGQPAPDEVFVPLTHIVKEKEGLYRIGQNYNKVSVDQIKAWNKLKSDETSVGANLVVGFLRVKRDLSPLASAGMTNIPKSAASQQTTPPVAKSTPPPATTPSTQQPAAKTTPPADNKMVTTPPLQTSTSKPAETAKTKTSEPVKTIEPPKQEPVTKAAETKTAEPVAKTAEAKPEPANNATSARTASAGEGAFAKLYTDQSGATTASGQAAAFKSTSGWKDGKYYVLMNKVPPGTIVRITASSSNKSVYAKVLGEIPAGKENEGLLVRLSNAALAQLAVPEGRFDVTLQY